MERRATSSSPIWPRAQACTPLAEELLIVRRAARSLPPLELPPAALGRASRRPSRLSGQPTAGAAVDPQRLATGRRRGAGGCRRGGMLWRRPAPPAAPTAAASTPVDPATATSAELLGSVEAEFQQAEKHLETAVAGLEVLARDRQALDPKVAADLQKSLLVIDQAIGESRAALKTQPMSTQAQDSLFEAFRSKIVLLQDTISLINEVRKGNQAEAARIADDMNKS